MTNFVPRVSHLTISAVDTGNHGKEKVQFPPRFLSSNPFPQHIFVPFYVPFTCIFVFPYCFCITLEGT